MLDLPIFLAAQVTHLVLRSAGTCCLGITHGLFERRSVGSGLHEAVRPFLGLALEFGFAGVGASEGIAVCRESGIEGAGHVAMGDCESDRSSGIACGGSGGDRAKIRVRRAES